MYSTIAELLQAYLDSLRGRACYRVKVHTASEWLLTLTHTPTRKEMLLRHGAKGHGDYQPGSSQANQELALLRAAINWGVYHECWDGIDPTKGIKKWKRAKRSRTGKHAELAMLLAHFEQATTDYEIRDRALFGLMLFTGCRPSEARRATLDAITPYGSMGAWIKGTTKTGEPQEVPLPAQLMPWIEAWQAIRHTDRPNPYLFPGQGCGQPISQELVRFIWGETRKTLGLTGLWNYDLRRTLATSMSNALGYDDSTIRAILNHTDASALGHYRFKSFDSLLEPIQKYADWLTGLRHPALTPFRLPSHERVPCHAAP